MRLVTHATPRNYRKWIVLEENAGRVPMARLIYGYVFGFGWGFLRPWEQHAMFPQKGRSHGIGHPARRHEPFWILRLWGRRGIARHKSHDYDIEGRYWYGLAWRKSWGKRWGIWRARSVFLDPDIVYDDPGQAIDWGEKPGEHW